MMRIQDAGHNHKLYLASRTASNTSVDCVKDLKFLAVDGMMARPGISQAPRSRHVSQTPFIEFHLALSRPALVKTGLILSFLAWSHPRCSFRSPRVTTRGSRLHRFCRQLARRTWTSLEASDEKQGHPQVVVE
eukprot:7947305-Pyramimonas_sp.AAC.1